MNNFLLITIIGIIVLGAIWSMYKIMTEAGKIYDTIRDIEQRANETNDISELENLWTELAEASKQSFHRAIGARINEVAAVIKTKHKVLKEIQGK